MNISADTSLADPPFYADKANLLVYADKTGALRPVASVNDWQQRRAHIVANMERVMGAFPDAARRVPLDVEVLDEKDFPRGDLTGWTSDRYMPQIRTQFDKDPAKMPFDFTEILAALAPRPVFISAPLHDANFEVSGVYDCLEAARPIYALFDAADRLVAGHPDCAHDFPPEVRERAYVFFDQILKAKE